MFVIVSLEQVELRRDTKGHEAQDANIEIHISHVLQLTCKTSLTKRKKLLHTQFQQRLGANIWMNAYPENKSKRFSAQLIARQGS